MNWNMIGHNWAVDLLQQQISHGTRRQSYLFSGLPGTGRRTLALRFAQAVNCQDPPSPGSFCGGCVHCRQIAAMAHPDLSVVAAEREGGILKVDQVRELQRSLSLAPYSAGTRVALLLRFDEANPSAANAMLKTLEEPAPRVLLLLTADSPESLLATISSRCEVIRLRPVSIPDLSHAMQEKWEVPAPRADFLAHLSGGRPGRAHFLHHNPEALDQRSAWMDDLEAVLPGSRVERFAYAESAVKDREAFRKVLGTWMSYWRDVMLASAGQDKALTNIDRKDMILKLAGRTGAKEARRALRALERSSELLGKNVNPRLVAEGLMLEIPRI